MLTDIELHTSYIRGVNSQKYLWQPQLQPFPFWLRIQTATNSHIGVILQYQVVKKYFHTNTTHFGLINTIARSYVAYVKHIWLSAWQPTVLIITLLWLSLWVSTVTVKQLAVDSSILPIMFCTKKWSFRNRSFKATCSLWLLPAASVCKKNEKNQPKNRGDTW